MRLITAYTFIDQMMRQRRLDLNLCYFTFLVTAVDFDGEMISLFFALRNVERNSDSIHNDTIGPNLFRYWAYRLRYR